MSYHATMMEFRDFRDAKVLLADEVWEHIQSGHPEISISGIEVTLKDPFEVRRSQFHNIVEIFYTKKTRIDKKIRFIQVVVKTCPDGVFVSTAMTTSAIKAGELIYKKENTS
jgi:hypothetical protein